MKPVEYGIPSWELHQYRARKTYPCDHCGGTIPKGTSYLRSVVRLGASKGKDPLKNKHYHIDCLAPWWHPEGDHQFLSLGQLPGRQPPAEVLDPALTALALSVRVHTELGGELLWQLPVSLTTRLLHSPRTELRGSALAELEQSLSLVLYALVQAAGSRKKSMQLNHLFHELALLTGYMPQLRAAPETE